MIDPQLLREHPDTVKDSQRARGDSPELVDQAIDADVRRRAAISESESLRASQKALGKEVAQAKGDEKQALLARAQELAGRVKQLAQAATDAEAEFQRIVGDIANPIIEGVPAGGEENFVTLREVGEKARFDFEPRDHVELGELLRAIDIARGTKISGSRFYFLTGIGARLEIALMNLALEKALKEGFTPLITPTLVRPEIMQGTGFLGEHSDEVYYLPADDLYLTLRRDPRPLRRAAPLRGMVDLLPQGGGGRR